MEIPVVEFCELVHNPEKYDNQILRTRAVIYFAFEASALYLPDCKSLDTWADYDGMYDRKAKESRNLQKILSKGDRNQVRNAELVIVGRFLGKRQALKLKDKTYYIGYGHNNVFNYQFTIMRVERAKAAPAYPEQD